MAHKNLLLLLQKEKAVVCLKQKYKEAFPDDDFFFDITKNESSQRSCPWLPNADNNFNKYREEPFFVALQVRKMYILEHSEYFVANINLFEQMYKANVDMINTLQLIVPVISSTFASVGNFLENVSSKQLGTLIIDEAGQATPYNKLA